MTAPVAAEIACALQRRDSFSSWGGDTATMSLANSLSFALENSMQQWQPPRNGRSLGGLLTKLTSNDRRLGAALDYAWMDYSVRTGSHSQADERSLSSGSRTPSPLQPSASSSPSPPSSSSSSSCTSSSISSSSSASSSSPEVYSRKVFVGGLPPDIDQDEIKEHFVRFGPLTVDWPHKAQSKAYFPPKGYAFLLFRDELAVHKLVKNCLLEEGKFYMFVSSITQTNKKVQIRPWKLSDSNFIMDHTQPIDARKTVFIGGVPRPLKACELADIFNSRYGNVCYAGIDCDPELKYPKGAGRVTFSSRVSFMSAVSCRFLQVTYGDIDKKVEVKPYVLDDQMCDECHGLHCASRYAPYFCGNIHCLRYYCEHCWSAVHSAPGTQNHRCYIKESGDRPRALNYFPSQPRIGLP